MKFWLACTLLAAAQGSCYDYEYYDPDTGADLGNACQGKNGQNGQSGSQPSASASTSVTTSTTTIGSSPQVFGTPTLGASPTLGATVLSAAPVAAGVYSAAPVAATVAPAIYGAPVATGVFGAPVATGVYGAPATTIATAPVYGASIATAPVYGAIATSAPIAISAPIATSAVVAAPAAAVASTSPYAPATVISSSAPVYGPAAVTTTTTATAPAANARASALSSLSGTQRSQLQFYEQLGQQQAIKHRRNSRIVQQASKDESKASVVNLLVAGSGKTASWFPYVRLGNQAKTAGAYRSEKNIAAQNAQLAYQRYQQSPTQLNLLISKYSDLNADLRQAAYHYNVVNSGTFGQQLAGSGILGLGASLMTTVSEVATQRSESNDLQDIERRMKSVSRQIQGAERAAQAQSKASTTTTVQTSGNPDTTTEQRLMALSVYGPQNRG